MDAPTDAPDRRSCDYEQQDSDQARLTELVRDRSNRISFTTVGSSTPEWSMFLAVWMDAIQQPFVQCKRCKQLQRYDQNTKLHQLMNHDCVAEHSYGDMKALFSKHVSQRAVIEALVLQNSPRIGYIPNHKGKSGVWERFLIITLDEHPVNFASCTSCRNIVTYTSRTGTGSMTRHRCPRHFPQPNYFKQKMKEMRKPVMAAKFPLECEAQIKEEVMEESAESWGDTRREIDSVTNAVPSSVVDGINDHQLDFFKKTCAMLEVFQGDAFVKLAQSLVDLGAEYGKIDVRDVLVDKNKLLDLCTGLGK